MEFRRVLTPNPPSHQNPLSRGGVLKSFHIGKYFSNISLQILPKFASTYLESTNWSKIERIHIFPSKTAIGELGDIGSASGDLGASIF